MNAWEVGVVIERVHRVATWHRAEVRVRGREEVWRVATHASKAFVSQVGAASCTLLEAKLKRIRLLVCVRDLVEAFLLA